MLFDTFNRSLYPLDLVAVSDTAVDLLQPSILSSRLARYQIHSMLLRIRIGCY